MCARPLRLARVVAAFRAEAAGDLSLEVGQVVILTKAKDSKQWWKGYKMDGRGRKVEGVPRLL